MRASRIVIALLVGALLGLGGCSPPREEPGLFGRPRSTPAATRAPTTGTDSPSLNPRLPVAADGTWISNDGRSVVVRYAAHAVITTRSATVLDWSVTVLSAAGISEQGARIPTTTDLALRDTLGGLDVLLVDADRHRVYRPLTRVGRPDEPYSSAYTARELDLRVGETRLLQTVFPTLVGAPATIDVDLPTIPPFWHVPVTSAGLPTVTTPTELNREVEIHPALATTETFDQGPGTQQFIAFVDDVIVADTFTAMRWTVQSITDGDGLLAAPPISGAGGASGSAKSGFADGPALVVGGEPYRARRLSSSGRGSDCLCSDLAGVTHDETINQRRTLVTTYPALPRGTQQVDIDFPGLARVTGVSVVAAADASVRVGPADGGSRGTPPPTSEPPAAQGWPIDAWPIPLPAETTSRNWARTLDKVR